MSADHQSAVFRARAHLMVEEQLRRRGIGDERLLAAMERVPRQAFAPSFFAAEAYEDKPLPIAANQTISQPYIVAAMLDPLRLETSDKVLEIGTGSGYETAILAELVAEVCSVERLPSLAEQARETLAQLNYRNVHIMVGDGTCGWPEESAFDAIVVSAAAPFVPSPLFEQLRDGGQMIIPVGTCAGQQLLLIRKNGTESITTPLEGCRFVPLVGAHGFPSGW